MIERFRQPSHRRAIWQLVNTLLPYLALWVLMARVITLSYWLILPVALVAAGLRVRLFIFMHDCGHGSFMRSKSANTIVGWVTGLLTFTPYHHWTWEHAIHHRTSGNLERRGKGDIWTMTVDEYLAVFTLAPLCLPTAAQSGGTVRGGADHPVRGAGALPVLRSRAS